MPFFSVVIPLYNKEALIGATLKSALKQTFADFEIIIINDGSTDASETVVKQFNDPRIRYYLTKNQKVSRARNTGIDLAEGKIIALLDADDYWEPDHLQELYDLTINHPEAGLYVSRYHIKTESGALIKPVYAEIKEGFKGIVKDPFLSSLQYRLGLPSAMAVRKEVFDTIGNFEESLSQMEDTDMWIRIVLRFSMALSPAYTVIYNFDTPDSLSKVNIRHRNIFDFNKFINEELENKSLKAFIDVYRIEYALKFRIEGDIKNSGVLYNAATPENISTTTKLLFALPPFVLRKLLRLKHYLQAKGFTFSVYN